MPIRLTAIVLLPDRRIAADERQLGGDAGVGDATSRPPSSSTAPATAASTCARSATSHSNQGASPHSAAVAASSSGSSPSSATRAPRCAAASRSAAPIPRAAPVISDPPAGQSSSAIRGSPAADDPLKPPHEAQGAAGSRATVGLHLERVQCHRQHLVVADSMQSSISSAASGAASPPQVSSPIRRSEWSSSAAQEKRLAPDQPGGCAFADPRDLLGGALGRAIRSCCCHS